MQWIIVLIASSTIIMSIEGTAEASLAENTDEAA